jgi:putative phosphoribosyl transferase
VAAHYEVLGVGPTASPEEVRRAYLDLARRHHPDAHAGAGAEVLDEARRRMQAVNEAWRVLGHPARRRAYDASLGIAPEAGDHRLAFDLADLLAPDPPLRPSTRADLVTLVPAALGVGAVVGVVLAVVLASPAFLALGLLGLGAAGLAFVLTPFYLLARDRRRGSGVHPPSQPGTRAGIDGRSAHGHVRGLRQRVRQGVPGHHARRRGPRLRQLRVRHPRHGTDVRALRVPRGGPRGGGGGAHVLLRPLRVARRRRGAARPGVSTITAAGARLDGDLTLPDSASAVVLFAHGSGSSRHSPRNRYVAGVLHEARLGTLLVDLLTPEEEQVDAETRHLRFDIELLATRLAALVDWLGGGLPVGLFGASTGGGAALVAASRRPEVGAVVSRGGRPDLAGEAVLATVEAPTLLVVGGLDSVVLDVNRQAFDLMRGEKQLAIVPGATHLFEEPGTLEQVARLARDWFLAHL